jgi:hypothetical protein
LRSVHRQQGVSFVLIGVVLLVVMVGLLGTQMVARMLAGGRNDSRVQDQFSSAHRALTQYVATAQRLPCPADPAAATGDEVAVGATCSFPAGTLPWKTIGLAREEAIDPWGQKISYRVYTGAAGSLTQVGGASMVECDTSGTGAATALAGSAGRLCSPNVRVTLRDTSPANFLAGKGYSVTDHGTAKTGVAYVLVSHGATGLGAYTTSGTRRAMPLGDELVNTGSAGPFVIKAFSAAGTDPGVATHFDDYVAYRTITELLKAAGVDARDWPEAVSVTFNRATVEAAVGGSVTPGSSVGQVTVNFVGAVVSGLTTAGTATDISYAENIGVGGIGVAGGGNAFLQSSASERLRLTIAERGEKFGATLNHFGYYSGDIYEIVEFRFFLDGVQVDVPKFAVGCVVDGGLASFDIDVGGTYDRVDITPLPAFDLSAGTLSGITALLVSEIKACPASATTCRTALWTAANDCPYIE